jgi:hypothetical protein
MSKVIIHNVLNVLKGIKNLMARLDNYDLYIYVMTQVDAMTRVNLFLTQVDASRPGSRFSNRASPGQLFFNKKEEIDPG